MRYPSLSLLALAGILVPVNCDTRFILPTTSRYASSAPVYNEGDGMTVKWESDIDKLTLVLWQNYPVHSDNTWSWLIVSSNETSKELNWEVDISAFIQDVPDDQDPMFHFALYTSFIAGQGAGTAMANSGYFNVSLGTTASASSSASSTSSTASATSNSTSATDGTNSSSDSSSKLSTGAVAGVAVGATIGGILVLGGLGLFFWKRFRNGNASATGGMYSPEDSTSKPELDSAQAAPASQWNYPQPPAELDYTPQFELAGTQSVNGYHELDQRKTDHQLHEAP